MNKRPCIDVSELTEMEAREWVQSAGKVAEELSCPSGVCGFQARHLPSVADALQQILDNTRMKINFLESVKITYPANRPISVHEEQAYLRKVEEIVLCVLQNIYSCQ